MDDETTETPWKAWQARLSAARRRRDDRLPEWQENVNRRVGTRQGTNTGATTTKVNRDWPLTKAKIAGLYSQTPEVRLSPKDDTDPALAPVVPAFAKRINDTVQDASTGTAIEEVLADVINASGIGAVLVSCEQLQAQKQDPLTGDVVPITSDRAYRVRRISPADLLVPSDFTGSYYDHARWLAHEDRMTWTQAQREFGLADTQKDDVVAGDKRAGVSHSLSTETDKFRDAHAVNYTEVFYWRHYYHAEETSFAALQRMVFVDGIEAPVINEPYRGQQITPDGVVGVVKNPIRILTLTYVSDDGLPPSDSTIGRFTANELEESRDAMVQQRKHSMPIRWFDSSRVSPNTRSLLEKGDYQGFIPTNGPGDRAVGEVARASFPQEKYEFDRILKNEEAESWQVGTNQTGAFASGERSASEAKIIQQNFQTRVGQEQDKVAKFFLGVAEVLAGHLALYGDLGLPPAIANQVVYSVRVDSTVRLNAQQRIEQLTQGLNLTAQSGYVNPKPVITEIWELLGVNPTTVVIDPQPKAPEPVKVSIGSAEDIINPVMLAAMMRTGQAPSPEDLAAAVKLLQEALAGGVPLVPPQPMDDRPPRDVETPGITNASWESAPRIERRAEDGGA